MLIDDFSRENLVSALGTAWRGVSDNVMGGISQASIAQATIAGRSCLHLTGAVSLENSGGFIQASLDLAPRDNGAAKYLDGSGFSGLRLTVRGNSERYAVHLRTLDCLRPWQSYRAQFTAGPNWESLDLPFSDFFPHRIDTPLNLARLRRIGLVAIGREFLADLAICELRFTRPL
jgi:hypothetical protein